MKIPLLAQLGNVCDYKMSMAKSRRPDYGEHMNSRRQCRSDPKAGQNFYRRTPWGSVRRCNQSGLQLVQETSAEERAPSSFIPLIRTSYGLARWVAACGKRQMPGVRGLRRPISWRTLLRTAWRSIQQIPTASTPE